MKFIGNSISWCYLSRTVHSTDIMEGCSSDVGCSNGSGTECRMLASWGVLQQLGVPMVARGAV